MPSSSATQLAGMLGVSVSTVTGWTKLDVDPLPFRASGNSRRIEFADYDQFRSQHPSLRKATDLFAARPMEEPTVPLSKVVEILRHLEAASRLLDDANRAVADLQREVEKMQARSLPPSPPQT